MSGLLSGLMSLSLTWFGVNVLWGYMKASDVGQEKSKARIIGQFLNVKQHSDLNIGRAAVLGHDLQIFS
jgi:hypothetical protein